MRADLRRAPFLESTQPKSGDLRTGHLSQPEACQRSAGGRRAGRAGCVGGESWARPALPASEGGRGGARARRPGGWRPAPPMSMVGR